MHTSGGGTGYCDCGDPEAWRSDAFCTDHDPEAATHELSEPRGIPEDVQTRLDRLMSIIVRYSVELLCWEWSDRLPEGLSGQERVAFPWQTMLFNDEHHTYEQVTDQGCLGEIWNFRGLEVISGDQSADGCH